MKKQYYLLTGFTAEATESNCWLMPRGYPPIVNCIVEDYRSHYMAPVEAAILEKARYRNSKDPLLGGLSLVSNPMAVEKKLAILLPIPNNIDLVLEDEDEAQTPVRDMSPFLQPIPGTPFYGERLNYVSPVAGYLTGYSPFRGFQTRGEFRGFTVGRTGQR